MVLIGKYVMSMGSLLCTCHTGHGVMPRGYTCVLLVEHVSMYSSTLVDAYLRVRAGAACDERQTALDAVQGPVDCVSHDLVHLL